VTDGGRAGRTAFPASATLLAFDTATSQVVVALGSRAGDLLASSSWPAGYRHGEQLLPSIERLLDQAGLRCSDLAGIIGGTGPGAFTGLRVGLATAKALAVGMALPLVGVSTAEALMAGVETSSGRRIVLLLPAGPNDRIVVRNGEQPLLLPAGSEPQLEPDDRLVAVDLEGRAPPEAVAAGNKARAVLGARLLRLGAARLLDGAPDDPAELVPEYVTLPRGVTAQRGEVAWSRDRRPA
jgi:tRNA threonylcarbamoyladenosine biosynthesis protein TsaB